VRPKPRGGAAFTQKSERLSDQIQKISFQIWDLTFCSPRAALLALERLFCSGEEVGVFRVNPVFLMPHWPMDMAALLGRSCTCDQAKHMFFRSYTALVSFCNDAHHSFSEKISSACSIFLAHGPHHEQHVSDM
jgi:hypothetical protein